MLTVSSIRIDFVGSSTDRSSGRGPTKRSYCDESFANNHIPPSYSVERSGEIIVYDESVPYITAPPIPDVTPVEMTVLAPHLTMGFELSLNVPMSLRLPRGVKPVRGLEKWRGDVEITHETVNRMQGRAGFV